MSYLSGEFCYVLAEMVIDEAKSFCVFDTQGQSALHNLGRLVVAHPKRQPICPKLGPIKVTHVLVVRVEDDAATFPNFVGRQSEKSTASASIALQSGYG